MQLEEALVPPGTAFLYHEEFKQTVGPRRVLKVYLVDKDGRKHLAATGEDLGDAHYHYRSTKPFSKYGAIDCHNRKELTQWLEMIISETSNKEGPHLDVDEHNPEGVYFTAHKYERAHMNDGRRVNRWYLVDQHGSAHLAVIGVERDTKDGHYTYGAEEPFASRIPLQCSNQSGVFKWLEKWITHHAAGTGAGAVAGQAASGTVSVGTAASAGGTSGMDAGTRNPPVFISLSAIRHARKSAAALLVASATLADPNVRAKAKSKQAAEAVAASGPEAHAASAKNKSLTIVQQNQIKKARKLQEDAKAEQERLVSGHLARLRRAAAAELQGDNTAKQIALSWLQGGLTPDELEALQHWVTLLSAVLDLQQRQQCQQQAASSSMHEAQAQGVQVEGPGVQRQQQQHEEEQTQQQQQTQMQKQGTQGDVMSPGGQPGAVPDQQQTPQLLNPHNTQEQEQHQQHDSQTQLGNDDAGQAQQWRQQQAQDCGLSIPGQPAGPLGAGVTDKELLTWLQQPGNERHYLRVTLECLKEIGAVELPARALLGHKVVALVRRCLAEHADESVRSLAQHMLQHWRWQLAGHLQVLTQPAYMEDHLAVLNEQVAAGLVPLPELPQHKQVLLSTDLPSTAVVMSGRMQHTAAHSTHHYVQQQQQQPPVGLTLPRKQAEAGDQAGGTAHAFGHTPHHNSHTGHGSLPQQPGYSMLNPSPLGTTGFATPLSALSGLYRAGSPALAAALGAQQSLLHAAGGGMQPSLLGTGQQMSVFQYPDPAAAGDVFGLNHSTNLLGWPWGSAGVPALGSVQLPAAGATCMPPLPPQQQQQQQSHYLGMPQQQQQQQQQLHMHPPGLAGTAADTVGGLQLSSSLLQEQQLALGQTSAGMGLTWQHHQQQQADGQQQGWLGFLQQPLAMQQDHTGTAQHLVGQGGSGAWAAF